MNAPARQIDRDIDFYASCLLFEQSALHLRLYETERAQKELIKHASACVESLMRYRNAIERIGNEHPLMGYRNAHPTKERT